MALVTRVSPLLSLQKKQAEQAAALPNPKPAVESAKPQSSLSALQAAMQRKPTQAAPAPSTPKPAQTAPVQTDKPRISAPPPEVTKMTPEESQELVKTVEVPVQNPEELIAGFKENLEKLNNLILADTGLSPFTVDAAKGYVRQIMIDLRDQPELDSCIIDRDVHNILTFIRTVKGLAAETQDVVKVKAIAKAKKGGVGKLRIDLGALPAFGLNDLGKLKT